MEEMWTQFKRVTKENAAIVIFAQLPFAVDVINANRKMFRYEWVWKKSLPVGFLNAKKMPLRTHENILVFYRKLPTYNPQWWFDKPYIKKAHPLNANCYGDVKWNMVTEVKVEDGRRYPLDVISFNQPLTGYNMRTKQPIRRNHSTEKPIDLCEYLIKTYTNEGELVLDACMGSGTTAVACVNTGRHFVGFETDKNYFETAQRRIGEAREAKRKEIEENDPFCEMYGREGEADLPCQNQAQGFDPISYGQIQLGGGYC